jgi:hypothetical protein
VYFNELGVVAAQAFVRRPNDDNTCHCHKSARLALHIVSPSLVRDMREANC